MPWHSDFADIRDEELYTDKSTFETEKSMLTSRFLKKVCFGAKSFKNFLLMQIII